MYRTFILAFVIGVFVYSARQAKKHTLPKEEYNVVVTFEPSAYTDIRWYQKFRQVGHWVRAGEYSLKGEVDIEAEELSTLIQDELDLPSEMFSVKMSPPKEAKLDYIVSFKDTPRPDIQDFPVLEILGKWEKYGKNGYRIWCGLPEERFREVISEETNLTEDSFTVYPTSSFWWTRIL